MVLCWWFFVCGSLLVVLCWWFFVGGSLFVVFVGGYL